MKICNKCFLEKELSDFNKQKNSKDGVRSTCRVCQNLEGKEYRKLNRKKINAKSRSYKKRNKSKIAEASKIYYDDNKEKCLEACKKWKDNNKDLRKKHNQEWDKKNRSKRCEISKNYRAKNPEKIKACTKKWDTENPEKRNALRAKRRAIYLQCTPSWYEAQKKDIQALYKRAKELYKETGIKHHVDHIYPLQPRKETDPVGLHVLANLHILTAKENITKQNLQPEEWKKKNRARSKLALNVDNL